MQYNFIYYRPTYEEDYYEPERQEYRDSPVDLNMLSHHTKTRFVTPIDTSYGYRGIFMTEEMGLIREEEVMMPEEEGGEPMQIMQGQL